jgi:hypothetical protein
VYLYIISIDYVTNKINLNDGRRFSFGDLDHQDLVKILTFQNLHQLNSHKLLDEAIRILIPKLEDITFNKEFDNTLKLGVN